MLEEKVGQMVMVGFRGLELADNDTIVRSIRELHLGGVVLYDYDVPSKSPLRNIKSAEQLKRLVAALQAAAATPLLIAIDQEGGRVARLKEAAGFPKTVSAQYLGERNDVELTSRNGPNNMHLCRLF